MFKSFLQVRYATLPQAQKQHLISYWQHLILPLKDASAKSAKTRINAVPQAVKGGPEDLLPCILLSAAGAALKLTDPSSSAQADSSLVNLIGGEPFPVTGYSSAGTSNRA